MTDRPLKSEQDSNHEPTEEQKEIKPEQLAEPKPECAHADSDSGEDDRTVIFLLGKANTRPSTWLISFGDLLTLLLCFFLTLASFGPIAAKRKFTKEELSHGDHRTDTPTKQQALINHPNGTVIASQLGKGEYITVQFREQDFDERNNLLSLSSLEKLKGEVDSQKSVLNTVDIRACAVLSRDEPAAWMASIERTLALRRQVIDAGLDTKQMTFQSIGNHCELFSRIGLSDPEVVAVLRVRLAHG